MGMDKGYMVAIKAELVFYKLVDAPTMLRSVDLAKQIVLEDLKGCRGNTCSFNVLAVLDHMGKVHEGESIFEESKQ